MNRREALSRLGFFVGGTIFGAQALISGLSPAKKRNHPLKAVDIAFLNEVGETIIPATENSGGAKAANVGEFMNTIVTDFYTREEEKIFVDGVNSIDYASQKKFGKEFNALSSQNRHALLLDLEKEATGSGIHYYIMLKQLTIWGWLTSEVAANEAFNHAPVPGRFDPCVEVTPETKALFPRATSGQSLGFAKYHLNTD